MLQPGRIEWARMDGPGTWVDMREKVGEREESAAWRKTRWREVLDEEAVVVGCRRGGTSQPACARPVWSEMPTAVERWAAAIRD